MKGKGEMALLAGSIVFIVLAFEVGVRILDVPKPQWSDRPSRFYLFESVADNRNPRITREKPSGTFRIFVIGDSFTYGGKVQYQDTLPKRLEKTLNLNLNQRQVEVINWGFPGLSTRMEVEGVKKALAEYQPDLIILATTLNDPEIELYKPPGYLDKEGNIASQSGLMSHWKGLAFVLKRYYSWKSRQHYIQYHLDLFSNRETLGNYKRAMVDISHLCADSSVPLIVVFWPWLTYPFDNEYPFGEAHKVAHDFLEELKIPELDLLNSFRGIPPERLQADPGRDAHPNEIAYRIAADALSEFLFTNQLVPEEVIVKNIVTKRTPLGKPFSRLSPQM